MLYALLFAARVRYRAGRRYGLCMKTIGTCLCPLEACVHECGAALGQVIDGWERMSRYLHPPR